MARAVKSTCGNCGVESEFDSTYAGCLRPCPACNAGVKVVDADLPPYTPRDRTCWKCWVQRGEKSPGIAFLWVTRRKRTEWHMRAGPLLALISPTHAHAFGHDVTEELSKRGWACAAHSAAVRAIRFWLKVRWAVVLVGAAAAAAAAFWLTPLKAVELSAVWGPVLAVFVIAAIALLAIHSLVLWAISLRMGLALEMATPSDIEVERTGQRPNVAAE